MYHNKRIDFSNDGRTRRRSLWIRRLELFALCVLILAFLCGLFFGVRHLIEIDFFSKPEIIIEEEPEPEVKLPPVKVKGLYVTAHLAGIPDRLAQYVDSHGRLSTGVGHRVYRL